MYKILANTLFLGKDIHFLPECHSTNDTALSLIRHGTAREGSLLITDHQTKGKGQRGNSWEAKAKENLTFSLVLQPTFLDVSEQFALNMCVSNAIRRVIQEYIPLVEVKWPNDLVLHDRGKLGGILIENILGSRGWEYAVVGIGLNVNQLEFHTPRATSFSLLTGTTFSLEELFRLLITQLEQAYIALKKGKRKEMVSEYLQHLYLFDQEATFTVGHEELMGKIIGLTESGNLLLELPTGQKRSFAMKEIKFPNF